MIYAALEEVTATLEANFVTDFAALAATYGVTAVAAVTIVTDQEAEAFVPLGAPLPAIGVSILEFTTRAKEPGYRDTLQTCKLDWYNRGPDPVVLGQQTRVAVEAMCQAIDRLAGAGGTIIGGGETEGSIRGKIANGYLEGPPGTSGQASYDSRAEVTFELTTQDTGL